MKALAPVHHAHRPDLVECQRRTGAVDLGPPPRRFEADSAVNWRRIGLATTCYAPPPPGAPRPPASRSPGLSLFSSVFKPPRPTLIPRGAGVSGMLAASAKNTARSNSSTAVSSPGLSILLSSLPPHARAELRREIRRVSWLTMVLDAVSQAPRRSSSISSDFVYRSAHPGSSRIPAVIRYAVALPIPFRLARRQAAHDELLRRGHRLRIERWPPR